MARDYSFEKEVVDWKWEQRHVTYLAPLTPDELELAKLRRKLNLEVAKAGFDAAGVVDPSGVCDGASMMISLHQGKYDEVGYCACSMIPYWGDAIAKPFKAFKSTKAIKELIETISAIEKKIKEKAAQIGDACSSSKVKEKLTWDQDKVLSQNLADDKHRDVRKQKQKSDDVYTKGLKRQDAINTLRAKQKLLDDRTANLNTVRARFANGKAMPSEVAAAESAVASAQAEVRAASQAVNEL